MSISSERSIPCPFVLSVLAFLDFLLSFSCAPSGKGTSKRMHAGVPKPPSLLTGSCTLRGARPGVVYMLVHA
eukprot:2876985-Pleurochrysis_carterae.AAC.2